MSEKTWKYFSTACLLISGIAFYLELWLLGSYAGTHAVRDDVHNIQYQYGASIFYLSSSEAWPIRALSLVFFASFILVSVIAIARREIRKG
jgi:hypothetical protein